MRGRSSSKRAFELAVEHGLEYRVGRVYLLLGIAGCRARSLERMEQVATDGLAFREEHDVHAAGRYLLAMRSGIELAQGDWDKAADSVSPSSPGTARCLPPGSARPRAATGEAR